jgi:hypothetical protein
MKAGRLVPGFYLTVVLVSRPLDSPYAFMTSSLAREGP